MATKTEFSDTIDLYVRRLMRLDLPTLLAIEAASFAQPWSQTEMDRLFDFPACQGMAVIGTNADVVGYQWYQLDPMQCQILRLAVHPLRRRCNAGGTMVTSLVRWAHKHKLRRVFADVPEDNLEAQLFFRSCDFKATKIIYRYFPDDRSAYRMERIP